MKQLLQQNNIGHNGKDNALKAIKRKSSNFMVKPQKENTVSLIGL